TMKVAPSNAPRIPAACAAIQALPARRDHWYRWMPARRGEWVGFTRCMVRRSPVLPLPTSAGEGPWRSAATSWLLAQPGPERGGCGGQERDGADDEDSRGDRGEEAAGAGEDGGDGRDGVESWPSAPGLGVSSCRG